MKRNNANIALGVLLLTIGVVLLAQNFGLFRPWENAVWMLLFLAGGIGFLGMFARMPANWWAPIPGFVLLSLGLLIGMDDWVPQFVERWGGPLFLGGMSLGFWTVYMARRAFWWAIIPAGVLLTLAVVAGLEPVASDVFAGFVFFMGIALTFALVYLAPPAPTSRRWAIFPAAGALLIGVLTIVTVPSVFNLLWPIAIIVGGLYLVYHALQPAATEPQPHDDSAPPQTHHV